MTSPTLAAPPVPAVGPGDTDLPGHIEHPPPDLRPHNGPPAHIVETPAGQTELGHRDVTLGDGHEVRHVLGEDDPVVLARHLLAVGAGSEAVPPVSRVQPGSMGRGGEVDGGQWGQTLLPGGGGRGLQTEAAGLAQHHHPSHSELQLSEGDLAVEEDHGPGYDDSLAGAGTGGVETVAPLPALLLPESRSQETCE